MFVMSAVSQNRLFVVIENKQNCLFDKINHRSGIISAFIRIMRVVYSVIEIVERQCVVKVEIILTSGHSAKPKIIQKAFYVARICE